MSAPLISKRIDRAIWDIKYSQEVKKDQRIIGLSCVYDGFYFESIYGDSSLPEGNQLYSFSNFDNFNIENNEIAFENTEGLHYAMEFVPSSFKSQEDGTSYWRVVTVSFYDNKYELKSIKI